MKVPAMQLPGGGRLLKPWDDEEIKVVKTLEKAKDFDNSGHNLLSK